MKNMSLITRQMSNCITGLFRFLPVLTVTGPRQSGKTTLCMNVFPDLPYVNLEDVSTLAEVEDDPKGFLSKYPKGVIVDEVQRYPEMFSYLQVEVDADRQRGGDRRFIVTGSNNFSLLEKVTQSLAGRTALLTLLPLSTTEILGYKDAASTNELILRGGYPAIWTHELDGRDILMGNYYSTYVERDVRTLINIKNLRAFQTFVRLCAGRVGQELNATALSVEVGVSVPTIQQWISLLSASYVIYLLQPYYANIGKRLTKTPKLYFYDTGLAAYLLGINSSEQMATHPLRGNLFENMVVNDIVKYYTNRGQSPNLFYYRDKGGHEVDVLNVKRDGRIEAFEVKASQTYNADYFKHLRYLKPLLNNAISRTMVLYDGEQENFREEDGFCNFRNIEKVLS